MFSGSKTKNYSDNFQTDFLTLAQKMYFILSTYSLLYFEKQHRNKVIEHGINSIGKGLEHSKIGRLKYHCSVGLQINQDLQHQYQSVLAYHKSVKKATCST